MVRLLRSSGFLALLIVALMSAVMLRPVSAQDATPEAEDMGDCVVALGIGAEGDACVNVLHLSPDAPAVDIWINGEKAIENLAFAAMSGWVALPAGEHQVTVTPHGMGADAAVIDAAVTLEAGAAYEIAATGLVAEIAPAVFQVNVVELMDGNARIRVIHTSPDAPGVDIALKGGDVLITNLEFPAASDYLEVPAGTYDLEVRLTGTETVALPLDGVELLDGGVYNVFAIGLAGDATLTVMIDLVPSEGAELPAEEEATPTM